MPAPQPGWAHTGLVFGLRNWHLPHAQQPSSEPTLNPKPQPATPQCPLHTGATRLQATRLPGMQSSQPSTTRCKCPRHPAELTFLFCYYHSTSTILPVTLNLNGSEVQGLCEVQGEKRITSKILNEACKVEISKLLVSPLKPHSLTPDVPPGIYENVCVICEQSALKNVPCWTNISLISSGSTRAQSL